MYNSKRKQKLAVREAVRRYRMRKKQGITAEAETASNQPIAPSITEGITTKSDFAYMYEDIELDNQPAYKFILQ